MQFNISCIISQLKATPDVRLGVTLPGASSDGIGAHVLMQTVWLHASKPSEHTLVTMLSTVPESTVALTAPSANCERVTLLEGQRISFVHAQDSTTFELQREAVITGICNHHSCLTPKSLACVPSLHEAPDYFSKHGKQLEVVQATRLGVPADRTVSEGAAIVAIRSRADSILDKLITP